MADDLLDSLLKAFGVKPVQPRRRALAGTDARPNGVPQVPYNSPSAMSHPPPVSPGLTPEQIAARDKAARERLAQEAIVQAQQEKAKQQQQLSGIKAIPVLGQVTSVGVWLSDTFSLGGRTLTPINELDPYNTIYGPDGFVGGNPWFTGGITSINFIPMYIQAFVTAYQHAKDLGAVLSPIQQYFLDHNGALPPPAGSVAPGALNPATDAVPNPQANTVPPQPSPAAASMAVASGDFIRRLVRQ